jgi:hypothetical protein
MRVNTVESQLTAHRDCSSISKIPKILSRPIRLYKDTYIRRYLSARMKRMPMHKQDVPPPRQADQPRHWPAVVEAMVGSPCIFNLLLGMMARCANVARQTERRSKAFCPPLATLSVAPKRKAQAKKPCPKTKIERWYH